MPLPKTSIMYLQDLIFFSCFLYILLVSVSIPHCRASDGCLEEGCCIIDDNSTLISPSNVFELGFFAPDHGNSKSRYLGIWYHMSNPKIIVWIANRDKPLLGTNGSLIVEDGNAMVLDTEGRTYWLALSGSFNFTNAQGSLQKLCSQSNRNEGTKLVRLCLEDSGNLALHKRGLGDQILWQSFDYRTDTFLPGMTPAEGKVNLTSWQAPNDPATGSFVFNFLQMENGNQLSILKDHSVTYWESSITPFDQTPQPLLWLLLNNNVSKVKDYNNTRLVINYRGQIQFWRRASKRGNWSLLWSEPKNKCDLVEPCGSLGICNTNNRRMYCKCLPGSSFNQQGDFTKGCFLKSQFCLRTYKSSEDIFLRMPMMKVKAPKTNETEIEDCETTCREDCTCLAYSCGVTDCTTTGISGEKRCMRWSNSELTDLQEEYLKGLTIFFRTTDSDIELSPKNCTPCGSYIIPYPLSTGASCGDSSYSNFKCNMTTGQVYFSTSNLTYNVTSLDPVKKKFTIQIGPGNSCDSNYIGSSALLPKYSLHYDFGNCNVVEDQSSLEGAIFFSEVEIGWKPPSEPACNGSSNCHAWPHTTCKTKGGNMRCFCGLRYKWDGDLLKCTKLTFFKVQVLAPCLAGGLAIILFCGTFFFYRTWKNRHDEMQRSLELGGDSTESIDVPFFDWQVILAATNNFADANKLGTGGFGSVYRGKLPVGQEMAVKRLSTVSVQGLEEFRTEVKLIAKLQHRNLVRLIGYCIKANEKILVYEYMTNGSLDSCLFDEGHAVDLDWKKRFEIILGIARGLLYLHQDSRLRIIHRDLKPSNILLDEELNPKISDFGIARIVGGKETQASTGRIVGTYGYMSPEYAYEGIFSVKSDVFSFGVVVLETICGRRNSRIYMFEHGLSLLGHAWKLWNEDKGLELMDPRLNESCIASELQKCIHIGLLCVQEDPSDRPTMSTIVQMLSTENYSLPLCKQPAFTNRKPLSESASSSSAKDMSMLHEMMTASTVGR